MEDNKTENSEMPRALTNEYVLEHLFTFLRLDDIKNCRLVNRTWKNVGASFLRKNTETRLNFLPSSVGQKQGKEKVRQILKSANCYKGNDSVRLNCPFSRFKFTGDVPLETLDLFVRRAGEALKELDIRADISLDPNEVEKFLEMKKLLKNPDLHKLSLNPDRKVSLFFNLRPNCYYGLRELYLNNCKIYVLRNTDSLSLNKIHIGPKNEYIVNGNTGVKEFVVNSVFDLRCTAFIKLEGENLLLDLDVADIAGKEVTREVFLREVKVINWEKCRWAVKSLKLIGVPLLEKTFMRIQKLSILKSAADLSLIQNPGSLTSLIVLRDGTLHRANFTFPNLRSFTLECKDACSFLPMISRSRKLSQLSFWQFQRKRINTMRLTNSFMPNNFPAIDKFTLYQVLFDDVISVPELVINDCQILDRDLLYSHMKFSYQDVAINNTIISFLAPIRFLYVFSSRDEYMNRIMVGPFGWIRWRAQL